MENTKKCFVIMPFSDTESCTEEKWTEIFEYIIKKSVEESGLGYECERSVAGRANIIRGILDALNKANVVIADLTDNNPNVFYELGVRHTLTNRTIMIAQGEENIPFDLKPYPVAFYSESPAKIAQFKQAIKEKLVDIEKNPERSDNPIADFLHLKNVDILAHEKSSNWKKLDALLSELSENLDVIDSVIEQALKNQNLRNEKRKGEVKYSVVRFDTTCLDLLTSTHYLSLPEDTLRLALKVREFLKIGNTRLNYWLTASSEENEKIFAQFLPQFKEAVILLTKNIGTIRINYINNNYVEPDIPPPILKKQEHLKYIQSS